MTILSLVQFFFHLSIVALINYSNAITYFRPDLDHPIFDRTVQIGLRIHCITFGPDVIFTVRFIPPVTAHGKVNGQLFESMQDYLQASPLSSSLELKNNPDRRMAMLTTSLSFASSTVLAPTSKQLKPRTRMRSARRDHIKSSEEEEVLLHEFDLKEYMEARLKRVKDALELAVPLRHPLRLHESMRYTLLAGGNRVASVVALASCELVGGSEDAAMPVACAVEMISTMGIIHDDLPCIDGGELRRGKPANHLAFGEGMALLAGDSLLALALEHVAARTCGVPTERVLRAVAELASGAGSQGMMAGQAVDIESEGREDVELATVDYIHTHKTGKLVEAAAASGAIVGGGGDEEVERVRMYARTVGLLSQVVDDILDATKTAEELGKTTGSDAARGKATYPKLLGVDGARDAAWALMARAQHELSGFDSTRAAPLYHLARFLANLDK